MFKIPLVAVAVAGLCSAFSPSASALGDNSTPGAREGSVRPRSPGLQKVPMEDMEEVISKKGKWINVRGLGKFYVPPNFPPMFHRCKIDTAPGTRCIESE